MLGNSFLGRASEAIPSQLDFLSAFFFFFNGEKWEAGEELAVDPTPTPTPPPPW